MTDDQLAREIQAVGKAALVTHLPLFRSAGLNEGAVAALNLRKGWSQQAAGPASGMLGRTSRSAV